MKPHVHRAFGLIAAVVLCAAPAQPPTSAPQPELTPAVRWHRMNLPSGMRVIIVYAPGAKRQSTFSFLPTHLANDDAGKAQWSHLLEHMMIRTTDAEGLHADGVMFNGETTDSYLRLETIAEPAKWKVSLERHVRWLQTSEVDPQKLEREKMMIAGEEQSTSTSGFTHKFAVAAWNQIVVHDQASALVHGDIQRAAADEVATYARSHIRLDSSSLIATIGPTPIAEMEREVLRLLGGVVVIDKPNAIDRVEEAIENREMTAKWDLPTRHVMLWWRLPDDKPKTLAAATAAGRTLMFRVSQRQELSPSIRSILPHATVRTSRGTFLILNACITDAAKSKEIADAMRQAVAQVVGDDAAARQAFQFIAAMARNEIMIQPDFKSLAAQVPETLRNAVEGLWLLGLLNYEYVWDVPAEEAHAMLVKLDTDAVTSVITALKQEPGTLVLEPGAAAKP